MAEYRQIPVNTDPAYTVTIGPGLLKDCGPRLRAIMNPCRMAVVTDNTVAPLYLDTVLQSLAASGFDAFSVTFPAGEGSKNFTTLSAILERLAAERLTRSDCVIALGGGVVGDMAGFAAACYLRGIRYVQMPTTLLAAVDSSVGGKTAIDLAAGKNLAGAFLQPAAVLCDTDCLKTLPPEIFADGAAEAVKTGVLASPELFALFESGNLTAMPEEAIAQCVAYKAGVVERDEREQGERKLLNLGHTIGHAIEKCSGYTIPHGHAVAAGLAIMARSAAALGEMTPAAIERRDAERICATLSRLGLPISTEYPPDALAGAALSDKKRSGDSITIVIPQEIGQCRLNSIPVGALLFTIRAGWRA